MVNPVLDESTHMLAEPLLPVPTERVPQSVQSEPYAHIENCEPLPPSSHLPSAGYWHVLMHMPVGRVPQSVQSEPYAHIENCE